MTYRHPALAMRTQLDTDSFLQRLATLIPPEQRLFRYGARVVGGHVNDRGFTLFWTDGEMDYQAIGVVRDGPTDRLIRVAFSPRPLHPGWWWFAGTFGVVMAAGIIHDGGGLSAWAWILGVPLSLLVFQSVLSRALRLPSVPPQCIDEISQLLTSACGADGRLRMPPNDEIQRPRQR